MYKLIKKILKTSSPVFIEDKQVVQQEIALEEKNKVRRYRIYDWEFELLWETAEDWTTELLVFDNLFIYNYNRSAKTVGRKVSDLNTIQFELDFPLVISKSCIYGHIAFSSNKYIGTFKIDARARDLIKVYPDKTKGNIKLVTEKFIVRNGERTNLLLISDWELTTLWQLDVSETCKYKDWLNDKEREGQITNIFLYRGDKLIVTTESSYIFCFELATGKELWKSRSSASWFTIFDNIAYCITNRSLFKINLDTGEKSTYGWEHNALPSFEFRDLKIDPTVHELIYHDGLLWTLAYNSGGSFVLAINPHDGHYEWIHFVEEAKDKVMVIKFHKNRLYLWDSTNTLHIYEKEPIT